MGGRAIARAACAVLLMAAAGAAGEDPAPTDLDALADEMSAAVESFRGIRFRSPVARRTRPREAVVEEFRPKSKKRQKGPGPSGETRALRFFGLLEAKAPAAAAPAAEVPDAAETEARFRAESVGGYYSARDKVFTLVEGDGGSLNRMIVFHELVHALEDQHYDFRATEKPLQAGGRTDRFRAFRALVEGSAQYHTDRWVDAEPGRRTKVLQEILVQQFAKKAPPPKPAPAEEGKEGETPETPPRAPGERRPRDDGPVYLMIREVMFPYHNGSLFLDQVLTALPPVPEGTDPLARLFADPPASTEQVLHPEKYLGAPDLPREVVLPDLAPALGEGWEKSAEDTLGELGVGIAMNRWLYPRDPAMQLAAVLRPPPGGFKKVEDLMNTAVIFRGTSGQSSEGWDGDRWVLYANGERECLAWVLLFDGEKDAAEFVEGYAKVLKHKYKGAPRGEDGTWTGTGGGSTAVVAAGDRVVVAERAPPEALAGVVEALKGAGVERDPRDAVPAK